MPPRRRAAPAPAGAPGPTDADPLPDTPDASDIPDALSSEDPTMAYPTSVNSQITDAVTQANVKVVGEAPAMALGSLYQSAAHSLGIMFENAVTAQQNQNIMAQAATTQGVIALYRSSGLTPPPSAAPRSGEGADGA
ncbi:RebB family R body protein [Brevundimonas sp. M20]|uniref:RebB family R body protein n=1 Tax=Brevundimonas sp. M20 TaxID=2591463 RepID=UPI001F10A8D9|nr:RebB family R body protein [Brevundimonas sp. M20]